MKKMILSMATLAGMAFAGAATAQDIDFNTVDANSDGVVTFEELQALLPELTQEDFALLDQTGTGSLTEDEFNSLFQAPAEPAPAEPAPADPGMEAPADPMAPADPGMEAPVEPMEPADPMM